MNGVSYDQCGASVHVPAGLSKKCSTIASVVGT